MWKWQELIHPDDKNSMNYYFINHYFIACRRHRVSKEHTESERTDKSKRKKCFLFLLYVAKWFLDLKNGSSYLQSFHIVFYSFLPHIRSLWFVLLQNLDYEILLLMSLLLFESKKFFFHERKLHELSNEVAFWCRSMTFPNWFFEAIKIFRKW